MIYRSISCLLGIGVGIGLWRVCSLFPTGVSLLTIAHINVSDHHKILVVAPHPDDETLSAGGLIQAARSAGSDVEIVVVTNGDGQILAPLVLNQKAIASSSDYIILGARRQAEAVSAITYLGLSKDRITFLGYPDGGLDELWASIIEKKCPVVSETTRAAINPYIGTLHPDNEYCGSNVLQDIFLILKEYKPDLIVVPAPIDDHPDHKSTSAFIWLALAMLREDVPEYKPILFGYLIHYDDFPFPKGINSELLLPPREPVGTRGIWKYLMLSYQERSRKEIAIQFYETQVFLLNNLLFEFARKNELFLVLSHEALSPFFGYQAIKYFPDILSVEDPVIPQEITREELIRYAKKFTKCLDP